MSKKLIVVKKKNLNQSKKLKRYRKDSHRNRRQVRINKEEMINIERQLEEAKEENA